MYPWYRGAAGYLSTLIGASLPSTQRPSTVPFLVDSSLKSIPTPNEMESRLQGNMDPMSGSHRLLSQLRTASNYAIRHGPLGHSLEATLADHLKYLLHPYWTWINCTLDIFAWGAILLQSRFDSVAQSWLSQYLGCSQIHPFRLFHPPSRSISPSSSFEYSRLGNRARIVRDIVSELGYNPM